MKLEFYQQIFKKKNQIPIFIEIRPVGGGGEFFHADRQTDRHTDGRIDRQTQWETAITKLIVAIVASRSFAKAPRNLRSAHTVYNYITSYSPPQQTAVFSLHNLNTKWYLKPSLSCLQRGKASIFTSHSTSAMYSSVPVCCSYHDIRTKSGNLPSSNAPSEIGVLRIRKYCYCVFILSAIWLKG